MLPACLGGRRISYRPSRDRLRASPSPSPPPSSSGRGRILRWISAQLNAVAARRTCRTTEPDARLFPLPVGEGPGEGNRLVVRFDTATRTLPEIVELRESSGRAGSFP